MNHGTPVDPANGCGTAGAFILDVGLCSSRLAAQFFGLVPAGSGTGGGSGSGGGSGTGGGSAGACQEWFDTNVNHFSAQRAVLCNARYCAKGSNELLGDSLDQTWVNQTEPAIFHAGRCGGSGTGGGVSGSGGGVAGTGGGASGTGGGTSGTSGGGEPTTTPGGCSAAPVSALGLGLLTAMRALRRRRGSREQRAGASPADRATSSTKSRSASHQQLVDQRSA